MTEKPLNVQVAEALRLRRPGYVSSYVWINGRRCDLATWLPEDCTPDDPPAGWYAGYEEPIRAYDIDWSATGPLIEKIGIHIGWTDRPISGRTWWAADQCPSDQAVMYEEGKTPLVAACRLILALAAVGDLPR